MSFQVGLLDGKGRRVASRLFASSLSVSPVFSGALQSRKVEGELMSIAKPCC